MKRMWIIGLIVGATLGAAMHGFRGVGWGALIGVLVGLLLGRRPDSAKDAARDEQFERFDKRIAHVQKAVEDIHWRLNRLEERGGVAASFEVEKTNPPSFETGVPESIVTNALVPEEKLVPPIALAAPAPFAEAVSRPAAAIPGAASKQVTLPVGDQAEQEIPRAGAAADIAVPERDHVGSVSARQPATIPPGIIERLFEGNIFAKLGVVVLFLGVGFALKYAYDRGMFPAEMRLFAVAAASGVMFFLGQRVLEKRRTYALILFGGATGLLYLDVFFALKTFALINAPVGFFLFAALGVATIALAVKYDSRAFAVLGLIGAFLAPILASTGSGNHVLLFSYYLLLNFVILAASWFKAWRELNFVGFVFTFVIALVWGYGTYQPQNFSTVEPFLIAFFLLYLAIPILFAFRQPPELRGLVDATLVFGMPLSAAMLQAALTRDMGDHVLAWSALGVASVYAMLAWALWRREGMRLIAEAHLALALVFGTVAPYFAFHGYPTFAFWTLEGAAIFWMGCRQKSVLARAFALCLQVGAAGYFWWVTRDLVTTQPWWNDRVIGCGLIGVASLLTAWFMRRYEESVSAFEASIQGPVIAWGSLWLLTGFAHGAWQQWLIDEQRLSALLMFSAICFTIFEWLGAQTNWRLLRLTSRAHVLLIGVVALGWAALLPNSHPLVGVGAFAWPLTFVAYFFILHRQCGDGLESTDGFRYRAAWVLMLLLATWEALWRYDRQDFGWVFAIAVAGLLAAALRYRLREFQRPGGDLSLARLSNIALLWALVWWFAGLHGTIETRTLPVHHLALYLAAVALSILAFEAVGAILAWTALRRTQALLTLAMLGATFRLVDEGIGPFVNAQLFAWILAFLVGSVVLARQERDDKSWASAGQTIVMFNLAVLLVAWEVSWRARDAMLSPAWQHAGVGLTIATGLVLATVGISRTFWPFGAHAVTFRAWSVIPLLVLGALWTLVANVASSGSIAPLPFVPILNPLDIAQIALFAVGFQAIHDVNEIEWNKERMTRALLTFSAAGFFWLNAVLLRTIHHWADVPFQLAALLHSVVAQASQSLLWTSTALLLMTAAGKRTPPSRALWMAGAVLLGAVLLKLFFNDLGNTGTVARIVSFIGVGILLMVIGYVAPVPPMAEGKLPEEQAPAL